MTRACIQPSHVPQTDVCGSGDRGAGPPLLHPSLGLDVDVGGCLLLCTSEVLRQSIACLYGACHMTGRQRLQASELAGGMSITALG